jgi:hypothetical protein
VGVGVGLGVGNCGAAVHPIKMMKNRERPVQSRTLFILFVTLNILLYPQLPGEHAYGYAGYDGGAKRRIVIVDQLDREGINALYQARPRVGYLGACDISSGSSNLRSSRTICMNIIINVTLPGHI